MMTLASSMSDDALTVELARLAAGERAATAALIVHLAEFDARRLYEGAGYSSMFSYCRAVLRLSEDAACNRIKAARATRRYPSIVAMLCDGSLSPTTVRLLAKHLTAENHEALLGAAAGKGKDEVEELLARWFPLPDVAPSVRKVPIRTGLTAEAVGVPTAALSAPVVPAPASAIPSSAAAGQPAVPAASRALIRPLAPERYEIRFTADAETRALVREAQDLLGHAVPTGDLATVFHRALAVLVADLKRRKFGATTRRRRRGAAGAEAENGEAAVRREVSARDANRCAFVSKSGHRCEERRFLEFHHIVPRAAGGPFTAANIALRCRAHNGYEVDVFFGRGKRWTKRETSGTRPGTGAAPGG